MNNRIQLVKRQLPNPIVQNRTDRLLAALFGIIFAVCAAVIVAVFKLSLAGGRWYVSRWKQADDRGRTYLAGGLIGVLVLFCGIGALGNTPARSSSSAVASSSQLVSSNSGSVATPTAREAQVLAEAPAVVSSPTATEAPTATFLPTPTATAAPPIGRVIKGGNLRSEPRIAPETIIGQLCPNDRLDYISQQIVDGDTWYRVRVTGREADCDAKQVAVGTEGWASILVISDPSYSVEQYAQAANIALPTAIIFPTATPKPTALPTPAATPKPIAQPIAPATGGGRVGAICRDGSRSNATGRGACSHHGGVAQWLYR
jgi:hypothetical protein